jgi:hypothetical protein
MDGQSAGEQNRTEIFPRQFSLFSVVSSLAICEKLACGEM